MWIPGSRALAAAGLQRAAPPLGLPQQTWHWLDPPAVGKDLCRERGLVHAQMILEHALEHGAQVDRRLEIAPFVQVGSFEARPVCDDATAFERAAGQERNRRGAMIGALGAVNARGAAELG